jgi:putative IMPACT (imprinted ancient) family translation regulator
VIVVSVFWRHFIRCAGIDTGLQIGNCHGAAIDTYCTESLIEVMYELQFDYTLMNEVMMIVKQYGCSVIGQEMQLFCLLRIGVPKARMQEVLYKLKTFHSLAIHKPN